MNVMLFLTEACPNDFEILRIIYFVKIILNIVFIVVPIGLILMIGLDFFKNVTASKEDEMKKNLSIAIKRIIYCVCIFFVPTIVNLAISLLGNLGVNYALYLDCANPDDIDTAINNKAYELVVMASDSLDYSQYSEAYDVVSKMQDGDLKTQYESRLQEVKTAIENNWESLKEDIEPITPSNPSSSGGSSGGAGGSSSTTLDTSYPDEVVENLAAFIGSEAGGIKEGFLAQLMTGAVYINNYYAVVNDTITLDNMCKMFSYANAYTSTYCNLTFSRVESYRGKFTDEQKNQLLVVAKILLTKQFTIPKDIRYQAADYIITNDGGTIWATCDTGSSVEAYRWSYFGCSRYDCPPVDTVDIYGNSVSNKFEDYQKIADDLFKKYLK